MAHKLAQTPTEATTVAAPVTTTEAALIALPGPPATPPSPPRLGVADGSIVDHAFTPWKPAPTRCNTCGKVARRHAESIVRAAGALIGAQQATDGTDKAPVPAQVAQGIPATVATPAGPAGKKVGLRRLKADPAAAATARLAKTSAAKAAGGRRSS